VFSGFLSRLGSKVVGVFVRFFIAPLHLSTAGVVIGTQSAVNQV
jgi:hypothetical protein